MGLPIDEKKSKPRPLRLLTIAAFDWRNGYEYALEAIQLIKQHGVDVEYRISGNGKFLEAIAFARYELGLMEQVQINNSSADDYDQLLDWADAFILAAVAGGAAHALDEAIASGLPVFVTDTPSLSARITERVAGFVVPRRNPQGLAIAILKFFPEWPVSIRKS